MQEQDPQYTKQIDSMPFNSKQSAAQQINRINELSNEEVTKQKLKEQLNSEFKHQEIYIQNIGVEQRFNLNQQIQYAGQRAKQSEQIRSRKFKRQDNQEIYEQPRIQEQKEGYGQNYKEQAIMQEGQEPQKKHQQEHRKVFHQNQYQAKIQQRQEWQNQNQQSNNQLQETNQVYQHEERNEFNQHEETNQVYKKHQTDEFYLKQQINEANQQLRQEIGVQNQFDSKIDKMGNQQLERWQIQQRQNYDQPLIAQKQQQEENQQQKQKIAGMKEQSYHQQFSQVQHQQRGIVQGVNSNREYANQNLKQIQGYQRQLQRQLQGNQQLENVKPQQSEMQSHDKKNQRNQFIIQQINLNVKVENNQYSNKVLNEQEQLNQQIKQISNQKQQDSKGKNAKKDQQEKKQQILAKQKSDSIRNKDIKQLIQNQPNLERENQLVLLNINDQSGKDGNGQKKDKAQNGMSQRRQWQIKQKAIDITSLMILKGAQNQRIARVQCLFNEFVKKYEKFHTAHQYVIRNLVSFFIKKKSDMILTCFILKEYFSHLNDTFKQLHHKSYKVKQSDMQKPAIIQNPLINMEVDFKVGFNELIYLRKSTGNQFLKFNQFVKSQVIDKIDLAFKNHEEKIIQPFKKVEKFREDYEKRVRQFHNQIVKVNKVYSKGKQGKKQNQDVFIEMAKFVKAQKGMRETLRVWGQSLEQFRQAYMKIEQTLLIQLHQIFNKFKEYSKNFYSKDKQNRVCVQIKSMQSQVKQNFEFKAISVITDMDYIKYALELNQKYKNTSTLIELKNKHFETFFTMDYFLKFTSQPAELLKGTSIKQFQLKKPDCVFINTIAGNLVQWNKTTVELQQKFAIKDINAKIVSQGVVQFNQLTKRFIFTENRTVRIIFKDQERAEQLITFLKMNTQSQY